MTAVAQKTVLTGCLAPIDRQGLEQLIINGKANPNVIKTLKCKTVAEGKFADLCVFDPAEHWTLDPARSGSRSRNSPYAGREMTGRVRHTVVAGEAVVRDGQASR